MAAKKSFTSKAFMIAGFSSCSKALTNQTTLLLQVTHLNEFISPHPTHLCRNVHM
jgi:hypothetical protein